MREGYLSALAARTLGTATMLRPATPSRYEPEALQADGGWAEEAVEFAAEPGRAATPSAVAHPRPDSPPVVREVRSVEPPENGPARFPESQDDGAPVHDAVPTAARAKPEASVPERRPRSSRSPAGKRAPEARLVPVHLAAARRDVVAVREAGVPEPTPRSADRTPPASAAGQAIVVRIGRIDVRAVHEPPAAAAAAPARPRPAAGPTLEEHLRARDRGRR